MTEESGEKALAELIDALCRDKMIEVVANPKKEPDFVVCAPVGFSTFTDNREGECAHCRCRIMWRPYIPEEFFKICMSCAIAMSSATRN